MDKQWLSTFRDKLDQHHTWPDLYIFKFIVPKGKEEEIRALFPRHIPKERPSKNGNYTSLTVELMMSSGEEIVTIYEKASVIQGLIAL